MAQLVDYLGGGGQAVGDILFSLRPDEPVGYLRTDAAVYLQSAYPELAAILEHPYYSPAIENSTNLLGVSSSVGFSVDATGTYLFSGSSTAPYFHVHKNVSGTWVDLSSNVDSAVNSVTRTSTDSTGTYTAVMRLYSGPYICWYKRTGDSFTKLTIAGDPADPVSDVAISPDGVYTALVGSQYNNIHIYKRTGDTFTELSAIPGIPQQCYSVTWNSDGTKLIVGSGQNPYLFMWNRSGDTFTQVASPIVGQTPSTSPNAIKLTPNNSHLYVTGNGELRIYALSGDTLTYKDKKLNADVGSPYYLDITPDGTVLGVGTNSDSGVRFLRIDGDTLTALPIPYSGLSGSSYYTRSFVFIPGEHYAFAARGTSLRRYLAVPYEYDTEFSVPLIEASAGEFPYIKAEDV